MELESVIGLEIHVQLKTRSKMFCSCSNTGENEDPNTTICPICLGHPGVLPVPNKQAIEWSVMSALALNCEIPNHSKFDRKHYFYPDLPKAYQISQFDEPIGINGYLTIVVSREKRKIRLHRLHLEEDAAKLLHDKKGQSFVDYNRGGTPLMEIVTEPDIRSSEEAGEFLRELRLIMRYLQVSDADMEKGHLRCDANVSLRPVGDEELYPKTEVKNLNSFKAVEKALNYEIKRQTKVWQDSGKAPEEQGTRGWDENEAKTIEQRSKEGSADYRYFPEPDIPGLDFNKKWVERIRATIPELPANLRARFIEQYGFKKEDAKIFSSDKDLAEFTEQVISELRAWLVSQDPDATGDEILECDKKKLAKLVSSWILTNLLGLVRAASLPISEIKITPENMAELITMAHTSKVNKTNAQAILKEMFKTGSDPSNILEEKDLGQMQDDGSLDEIIDSVIASNPDQVEQYKSGKTIVINFLVGMAMKESKGKADASQALEMLKIKLK
ncbi:Asp-tRNA(Asn)/Glu-tRNA(Gln) amidotransferase subunit GatB [Patescibacteria group bacterium]|nr:Asp-tRNA(Asn)/Glu-tRNA(Gln) amidotransferase subunit GatB [Patescibacteria group bacterium]